MNKLREFGQWLWSQKNRIAGGVILLVILGAGYLASREYRELVAKVNQLKIGEEQQYKVVKNLYDDSNKTRLELSKASSLITTLTSQIASMNKAEHDTTSSLSGQVAVLQKKVGELENGKPVVQNMCPFYTLYNRIVVGQTSEIDVVNFVNHLNAQEVYTSSVNFLMHPGKDELEPTRGAIVTARTYSYLSPNSEPKKEVWFWLTVSFDQNGDEHHVRKVTLRYQGKSEDSPQVILQK